jgi:hypothetical protein
MCINDPSVTSWITCPRVYSCFALDHVISDVIVEALDEMTSPIRPHEESESKMDWLKTAYV